MSVETRTVTPDEADMRLDRWFRKHLPQVPHGRLEKLLRTGQIRVDGRRAKANQRLGTGQQVRIPPLGDLSETGAGPAAPRPAVSAADAEDLQRRVLYRDDDVIVLNKPAGLAVQGGTGTTRHLDAMLGALAFDAPDRPKLVHRLDRDTSGVLLLARSARAARTLTAAFRGRDVRKLYWAVVVGVPGVAAGTIRLALDKAGGPQAERVVPDPDGQSAITDYRILDVVHRHAALLAMAPRTGRTHQLRAHCAALGTPILGDGKYAGAEARLPGLMLGGTGRNRLHLHARRLALTGPSGQPIDVTAPPPPHLADTLETLGLLTGPQADQWPDPPTRGAAGR